jgi:hypothetical protein
MKLPVAHIIAVILILIFLPLLMGADFMYWESDFAPIVLPNLTTQSASEAGSSNVTLFTSGDAEISANNSTTARLSSATDSLVTEYKLTFDGDGSSATGGSTVDWTAYDSFLTIPAAVTYVPDDNDVVVTLEIRASNYSDDLADAGTYTATQTLTVSWVGP